MMREISSPGIYWWVGVCLSISKLEPEVGSLSGQQQPDIFLENLWMPISCRNAPNIAFMGKRLNTYFLNLWKGLNIDCQKAVQYQSSTRSSTRTCVRESSWLFFALQAPKVNMWFNFSQLYLRPVYTENHPALSDGVSLTLMWNPLNPSEEIAWFTLNKKNLPLLPSSVFLVRSDWRDRSGGSI